jgi:hypothetical protein
MSLQRDIRGIQEGIVGETTKRFKESLARPGGPDSKPAPVNPRELQVRIACAGQSAAQVLDEVRSGLMESVAQDRDPLIVLEELGLLQDSVTTLIKGLSRVLVGFPRTVTFWESSGYTEAFMSVMEAAEPPAPKPSAPPAGPAP